MTVALVWPPTSVAALAQAQSKIDVTGTWAFEVQTEAGTTLPSTRNPSAGNANAPGEDIFR